MSDVINAMAKLREYADELDALSKSLTQLDRQLEPVEKEVTKFVDDYELGLYQRSTEEDDYKLPSEAMREKLARRAMPVELYGRHTALVHSRDRMKRRISELKLLVESQRSILSAEKSSMEASGSAAPPQYRSAA